MNEVEQHFQDNPKDQQAIIEIFDRFVDTYSEKITSYEEHVDEYKPAFMYYVSLLYKRDL